VCILVVCATANAQEDNAPVRSSLNPLVTKGPTGSYDQLKIGPRAILREAPSRWTMWYEAVPAGNKSYTAYATSSDGLVWTRFANNPVMSPSEPWEGGAGNPTGEVSPTSVLREKGLYRLWYHGFNGGTRQVGYATSPDGVTWTKYAGNPVLSPGPSGAWDADSICEPVVVHVGPTYYMYYSHCVGSGGIGLATSVDGVTWTKYAGNPVLSIAAGWENAQIDWGGVYHDGERFHIWYLGRSTADTAGFSMGYASSTDGMAFTKSPANPILRPPNPLIVSTDYNVNKGDGLGIENSVKPLRLGDSWRLYYGGFASCCPEDATLDLGVAPVKTSPNKAPIVDAGADQTIALSATTTLDGTVMDDDVPVTLQSVVSTWTKVSGPGTATFANPNRLDTTVRFDAPGVYLLRLTADDTALKSTADVSFTVLAGDAGPAGGSGLDAGSQGTNPGSGSSDGAPATASAGPAPSSRSGCGCRSVGARPWQGELGLVAAGLLLLRRRRRSARSGGQG
jgi:predicted GH43/DUF377 family glycosyl hydrolase